MNEKYKIFWKWFLNHEKIIEEIYLNKTFIDELEIKIKTLGDFTWELGPGFNKPLAFTISPGDDPNVLLETKKIISFAPILDKWEFYPARQIKEWDNYFEVFINGQKLRMDISKWEYVLLQYEDNTLDIIIKPEPYIETFEKDINGICDMVIDSIIGEEVRIDRIQDLAVVREFDSDVKGNATNIKDLQKHLSKLYHELPCVAGIPPDTINKTNING